MNPTSLFLTILFGSAGAGFFIYGKRQRKPVPLLSGLVLFALPYLSSTPSITLALGGLLVTLPFVVRT